MGGKPRNAPRLVVCETAAKRPRFIVCETVAAITLHLRELEPDEEPCYTGRKRADATTLCGARVGWDTRIPLGHERCRACIEVRDRDQ